MNRLLGLAVLCIGVGIAAPCRADDVKLDPVVVKSLGQPAADSPTETRVIDPADVERRSSLDMAEALRAEPGVQVTRQTGLGDSIGIRIRGSNENQVLLLQDGVPINDWSFGGGGRLSGSDPQSYGRLEVVRGPFSALSASAAIGGVVRLETVQGAGQDRLLGRLDAGAPLRSGLLGDALGGRLSALATTGGTREFGGLAGYAGFTQAGATTLLPEVGALALPASRFDRGTGALSWETPAAGGKLLAVARIESTRSRVGIGTFELGDTATYFDSNRVYTQQMLLGSLRWTAPSTDTYAWSLRAGGSRLSDRDDDPFFAGDGVPDGQGNRVQMVGRVDRVSAVGVLGTDHALVMGPAGTLLFGAELQYLAPSSHGTLSGVLQDGTTAISFDLSGSQGRGVVGTYVADRLTFGDLDAQIGVRADEVQRIGASVDPRGTIGYRLPLLRTRLSISGGTGYRAPAFTEVMVLPFSNPDLKPEHGTSWELAATQPLGGRLGQVSGAIFTTRYRDLIGRDPDTGKFANIAHATLSGGELAAEVTPGHLRLGGQVSYVRGLDDQNQRLPDISELLGNAHVGWTLGGLDADLFWYAWSNRLTSPLTDLTGTLVSSVPGGNRMDLSASYWFTQQAPTTRLVLRVEDLLDRRLPEAAGFAAPGRSIVMGFEIATR